MQSKLTDVLYEKKEYSFFVWQSCCVRGGGKRKKSECCNHPANGQFIKAVVGLPKK